jgi:hypothetical protein
MSDEQGYRLPFVLDHLAKAEGLCLVATQTDPSDEMSKAIRDLLGALRSAVIAQLPPHDIRMAGEYLKRLTEAHKTSV